MVVDKVYPNINLVELKGAPNTYDPTTITGAFAAYNVSSMSVSSGEDFIPETKQFFIQFHYKVEKGMDAKKVTLHVFYESRF